MVHYRNHFCFVPIERRKKTTQKHSPAGGSGETEMTRWSRHDQRAILIPAVTHCCLSTLTSASFSSHFLSRCTRARNLLFDSYSRLRISIGKKNRNRKKTGKRGNGINNWGKIADSKNWDKCHYTMLSNLLVLSYTF